MALYQIAAPCGCCYYRATFTTTTTTSCTTQIDSFDEAENKSCRHHHHHRRDQKGGIVFEKRSRLGLLQRRAASPSLFQSVQLNSTQPDPTKPDQTQPKMMMMKLLSILRYQKPLQSPTTSFKRSDASGFSFYSLHARTHFDNQQRPAALRKKKGRIVKSYLTGKRTSELMASLSSRMLRVLFSDPVSCGRDSS